MTSERECYVYIVLPSLTPLSCGFAEARTKLPGWRVFSVLFVMPCLTSGEGVLSI